MDDQANNGDPKGLSGQNEMGDFTRRLEQIKGDVKGYRDEEKGYKDNQRKTNDRMVLFTLCLVLTSTLAGVMAWRQANIAETSARAAQAAAETAQQNTVTAALSLRGSNDAFVKTLEQMRLQTDSQANSARGAQSAARSAETAIATQRDIAQLDERAWVGVYPHGVRHDKFITGIQYDLTNVGKTPGLKVKVRSRQFYLSAYDPCPAELWKEEGGKEDTLPVTSAPLFPNEQGAGWIDLFKAPYQRGLMNGAVAFVYGEVTYEDIFKKQHTTQFSAELIDRDGETQMRLCDTHNSAN